MHAPTIGAQAPSENRTERVTITVTPNEKAAVRAVAAIRGTDESNLVRTTPISYVVSEFERLRARVEAA
jgi:uncharacterized protein (DUF1778 family)